MITPRRTRLVRVADLRTSRAAISHLAAAPGAVVVVPTRAAARLLQASAAAALATATVVTRDGLYDFLHARLAEPPRRLSTYERDVMMQAAARRASPSATVRPGLVVEMVRFYDQLRRQGRHVARFEELLVETLSRDAEFDRGAERMLDQAAWLAEAFRDYERQVATSDACDEHTLRERLLAEAPVDPVRHLVVTVADWIADPSGLYLADFDLLTRLPSLDAVDLIATDRVVAAGFHERIHDWLPGIEEVRPPDIGMAPAAVVRPTLLLPPGESELPVFVVRDREEELIAAARRVARAPRSDYAVVYKRPLPYLYLAPDVFGAAGLSHTTFDTLPLAAEPFAAALDVVLEFVEGGFTRAALVALLRSPFFALGPAGVPVSLEATSALDRSLSKVRYLGGIDRLRALAGEWTADVRMGDAVRGALSAAEHLAPLTAEAPASAQLQVLLAFLDRYGVTLDDPDGRLARGRAAIRRTLDALAHAHAMHDDVPLSAADLATRIRHWIEQETFDLRGESPTAPDRNADQPVVHLVDDQAARYADFDDITIVGLIENEWPERPRRNIFYPVSLLTSLGWPSEKDRRAAAGARFLDLLESASTRVVVSTITLDDEALVEPSALADDIPRARLSTERADADAGPLVFADERLWSRPVDLAAAAPEARAWAEMRMARTPAENPAFHGTVAGFGDGRSWSVSALETYLGCPFKFFAQRVLKLEEEPEDEEVMDPRTQGEFMHQVFETFFGRWQDEGHQAITPDNLIAARAMFGEVVEDRLRFLSDTEAALERTRLLGSPAAGGIGEAVLRMEAERPVPVVERRLEEKLEGTFVFETAEGPRSFPLRGKADRLDLLADGTFRVIDYKLGWPPNKTRALQLPIYGLCAEQRLKGHLGRNWTLGEAAYLAFKGPKRVVPLFTSADDRTRVLAEAQQRLADTIDAVARGHFPPSPDDVFRCETCAYTAVCRKDYVDER